jgi:uncharacterized protein YukE
MPDEYYHRYHRYSHDELYRQLNQGAPTLLMSQADSWRQAGETAGALATTLHRDLNRLANRWTGLGSDEFQTRIGLIATYAQQLADEAASIGVGTVAMARALAETQRLAEPDPAAPVSARPDSLVPTVWFDPATTQSTLDAVVGPALGHIAPSGQTTAAYERMVTLVAELAAQYDVVDQANWPTAIPDAPAGLPGSVTAVVDPAVTPTSGLAGVGVGDLNMHGSTGLFPGGIGLTVASGPIRGGGPIGDAGTVSAVLSGAGPGLAGAPKASVKPFTATASPAGGVAPNSPMLGAAPMMAGGAVIGQPPPASSTTEDGADWWTGRSGGWTTADADADADGTEPPPSVVDGSA